MKMDAGMLLPDMLKENPMAFMAYTACAMVFNVQRLPDPIGTNDP